MLTQTSPEFLKPLQKSMFAHRPEMHINVLVCPSWPGVTFGLPCSWGRTDVAV